MDFPRKQIKANARAALSANYWPCVGILLLGGLLSGFVAIVGSVPTYVSMFNSIAAGTYPYGMETTSPAFSLVSVAGAFVAMFFEVGMSIFAYHVYRGDAPEVGDLFAGFKDGNFGRVLGGMFLVSLYTVLWSLLLIIPGIIKAYQYSMMPYLLVDRPDLSIRECFKMSKEMTDGHKWHLFVLDLSFIGWALLAALSVGILDIFYVTPYMTLASAGAYDFLKRTRMPEAVNEGPVFQSASYEANYTGESTNNNDNMFDE